MKKKTFVLLSTIVFSFGILSGCQTQPTKIYEQTVPQEKTGDFISKDTIVIDARPAFEYVISHLPGSLNFRWEDFSQKTEPFKGLLEKDLFFHARRLARYGISPQSKILIVGRGHFGGGEEGRLAWTLKLMGIKDVTIRCIDAFSIPLTRQEPPPRESVPLWRPIIDESLTVEKNVFMKEVLRPHHSQDYPVVIDVRSEREYLGKETSSYSSKNMPNIYELNIVFREFFTVQGDIQSDIQKKLEAIGITKDKKIYVIDGLGVRSAAVTFALRELGYQRAANAY